MANLVSCPAPGLLLLVSNLGDVDDVLLSQVLVAVVLGAAVGEVQLNVLGLGQVDAAGGLGQVDDGTTVSHTLSQLVDLFAVLSLCNNIEKL